MPRFLTNYPGWAGILEKASGDIKGNLPMAIDQSCSCVTGSVPMMDVF